MTAVRALIAEDEPLLAEGLRADLTRLWPGLDIVAVVGDGDSAIASALRLQPALCFFDIRMPGCDGLQAAMALAEDWPDGPGSPPFPLIVFVTAYEAHALQAFDARAVDYLVKPVDPARLAACVARVQTLLRTRAAATPTDADGPAQSLLQALAQLRGVSEQLASTAVPVRRLEVIQAQVGSLVHLVPIGEVIYFEAADKYLRVITAEREHLIRQSLRELMPQLDPAVFWQVHRGTVVRASAIATARRDDSGKVALALRGRPETLPVSRLYAHRFKGM